MTASAVTAFLDDARIASGDREAVTRLIEDRYPADDFARIQVFEDASGRRTDLDYWDAGASGARGPGRPKLGVTAREITLLPRHWEWLSAQSGGASAALRRLVDEAQRKGGGDGRAGRDAAYRFMQATCGDRPGYEEALRALYRGDGAAFEQRIADWPEDIRAYVGHLLGRAG
jgi:hypothetical protein